jgi:hypothetical protein
LRKAWRREKREEKQCETRSRRAGGLGTSSHSCTSQRTLNSGVELERSYSSTRCGGSKAGTRANLKYPMFGKSSNRKAVPDHTIKVVDFPAG